jgi:hypothetical protein
VPELPERADIDQLRRQARELLRAAVAGEPEAVAALSAVSERPTLAAAQLAIAREHGFRSWPALRAEIESRRQSIEWRPRADAGQQEAPGTAPARRSFAGAGAITVEEGELTPRIVVAGPESAFLEASLAVAPEAIERTPRARSWFPELRDVTITDDQGSTFTLVVSGSGPYPQPGPDQRLRCELTCQLDPVPEGGSRWLDVHGQDTYVTRLLPADPVPARVHGPDPATASPAEQELQDLASWILQGYLATDTRDTRELKRRCRNVLVRTAELRESGLADGAGPLPDQLARLCTSLIRRRPPAGLPSSWRSVLDAADRADGPRTHVDIGTSLPLVDGISVRLDALASWPDSWGLYLQAKPGWWTYSTDGQHKRGVSVSAEDDLGGLYISNFGGSFGRPGYEQVKLTFRPRLDPGASLLGLTLASQTQQVTAQVPLAS